METETPIRDGRAALDLLMAGNARFRDGKSQHRYYEPHHIRALATGSKPIAAVVSCMDSRVTPEIVFDQPLGRMFVSRVPGNVASDGTKWMIDLAFGEFALPLLLVLGHTTCLAIKSVMDGDTGGVGAAMKFAVLSAVERAKRKRPLDLYRETVYENVHVTIEHLTRESWPLRRAIESGKTVVAGAVYDVHTGQVVLV